MLVRLNRTVDGAVAAVLALLTAGGRDEVLPLYGAVKGLLCCSVPDAFAGMWTALSIGGMLAWCVLCCGGG